MKQIIGKQMRVGVKYWNDKGDAFYVVKMKPDGTMYSSTQPRNPRPFSLDRANLIHSALIADGLKAIKIYE